MLTVATFAGSYLAVRTIGQGDTVVSAPPPGAIQPVALPHSPAIEATYGVQFTRVGLSGDGGLIDVRFRILDTLRASPVLGHHATIHMVIGSERTNTLLDTRGWAPGESNLIGGASYWVLFRNAGGTVVRGDYVDIFVGSLHLDHVRVL